MRRARHCLPRGPAARLAGAVRVSARPSSSRRCAAQPPPSRHRAAAGPGHRLCRARAGADRCCGAPLTADRARRSVTRRRVASTRRRGHSPAASPLGAARNCHPARPAGQARAARRRSGRYCCASAARNRGGRSACGQRAVPPRSASPARGHRQAGSRESRRGPALS